MSEVTQRMAETRFDDTAYKLKKRELMRKKGYPEDQLPFPEVAIEADQPLLLPVVDSIVRTCIEDVAAIAEVSTTEANALISRSLARIHFAK